MAQRAGRYNLDPGMRYFATPPVHGALARYVDHPAYQCFKMPHNVSFEEGAMVEPLSNGMQACRRGEVKPGKSVLILGAGPMGKLCLPSRPAPLFWITAKLHLKAQPSHGAWEAAASQCDRDGHCQASTQSRDTSLLGHSRWGSRTLH